MTTTDRRTAALKAWATRRARQALPNPPAPKERMRNAELRALVDYEAIWAAADEHVLTIPTPNGPFQVTTNEAVSRAIAAAAAKLKPGAVGADLLFQYTMDRDWETTSDGETVEGTAEGRWGLVGTVWYESYSIRLQHIWVSHPFWQYRPSVCRHIN